MNELIQVTTGEQGSPVVKSARELHGFLESKQQFADWFRNRVTKYDFVEGRDYTPIVEEVFHNSMKNPKGGRTPVDYALSLDMAKELAMVERTEKGKQARQYFIEKEKQLRQVLTSSTPTEQVLLHLMNQSTQLLANQQQLLLDLRADVDRLKSQQAQLPPATLPPHQQGQQLGLPGIPTPRPASVSLRQAIHRHVSDYSAYFGKPIHETYGYLYKRMFELHGLSVHRLNRLPTESLLDVLGRYNELGRFYDLAIAELFYPHE